MLLPNEGGINKCPIGLRLVALTRVLKGLVTLNQPSLSHLRSSLFAGLGQVS